MAFFPGSKNKIRIFFAAKKFHWPGRSGFFLKKSGTAGKFTTKQNTDSQLYTRYPGNYPVTGWLLHTSFSGKNIFAGSFPATFAFS
jgi:hypothetical protein